MNFEAAVRSTPDAKLIGDLTSLPKPERALYNSDIYGLLWARPYAGLETGFLDQCILDRMQFLRSELAQVDFLFDSIVRDHMGPQFRTRPDLQRMKIAVEQWVPALDIWMVNGYFDPDTTAYHIVSTLQAGDPRRLSPIDALAERRAQAESNQISHDRASTDRVLGAVDALTDRQVQNFVAVEQALQTGETITVREDDRRQIENLVESTRHAAYRGDVEAQQVMIRGQRDNPSCLLPSTNPLRHRHKSELNPQDPTRS